MTASGGAPAALERLAAAHQVTAALERLAAAHYVTAALRGTTAEAEQR